MEKFLNFIKKYKLLLITFAIIIIIAICLIIFLSSRGEEKELELSDFEKIAIYNYLENDFLDMQTLYLTANNNNLNDVELMQVQIQDALDTYFSNNPDATSVSVSEINSILSTDYNIDTSLVDFHGLVLSNYEYNPDTDEIVVNPNTNIQADTSLYNDFSNLDNQSLDITKITQISDNQYKVYGNILDNDSIISTIEITLKVENDALTIENCSITDQVYLKKRERI